MPLPTGVHLLSRIFYIFVSGLHLILHLADPIDLTRARQILFGTSDNPAYPEEEGTIQNAIIESMKGFSLLRPATRLRSGRGFVMICGVPIHFSATS